MWGRSASGSASRSADRALPKVRRRYRRSAATDNEDAGSWTLPKVAQRVAVVAAVEIVATEEVVAALGSVMAAADAVIVAVGCSITLFRHQLGLFENTFFKGPLSS